MTVPEDKELPQRNDHRRHKTVRSRSLVQPTFLKQNVTRRQKSQETGRKPLRLEEQQEEAKHTVTKLHLFQFM